MYSLSYISINLQLCQTNQAFIGAIEFGQVVLLAIALLSYYKGAE